MMSECQQYCKLEPINSQTGVSNDSGTRLFHIKHELERQPGSSAELHAADMSGVKFECKSIHVLTDIKRESDSSQVDLFYSCNDGFPASNPETHDVIRNEPVMHFEEQVTHGPPAVEADVKPEHAELFHMQTAQTCDIISSTTDLKYSDGSGAWPSTKTLAVGMSQTANQSSKLHDESNHLEHASIDTVHSTSSCIHKGVKSATVTSETSVVSTETEVYPTGLYVNDHAYDSPRQNEVFSEPDTMEQEVGEKPSMRVESKQEKSHKCSLCPAEFSRPSDLKRHLGTHTGEKLYQCPECDETFTRMSTLTVHKRIHSGEKPYKCSNCNAAFRHSGTLTKHMRTHTLDRPYECPQCYVSLSSAWNLKIHLRNHAGDKQFKCTECPAAYAQSGDLKLHCRRVHDREEHICSECAKVFFYPSSLKKHMKAHKRAYKCSKCPASFKRASALHTHMETHVYSCSDCLTIFKNEKELEKHVKELRSKKHK